MKRAGVLLLLQAIVITAIAAFSSTGGKQAAAFHPMPEETGGWSITCPTEGMIAYGPVTHLGLGPQDDSGQLLNFYYNDTIHDGVFPSELTLEGSESLSTLHSRVWTGGPYGDLGQFYSAVISDSAYEENNPFSSNEPEEDVDALLTAVGGAGVMYWVTIED